MEGSVSSCYESPCAVVGNLGDEFARRANLLKQKRKALKMLRICTSKSSAFFEPMALTYFRLIGFTRDWPTFHYLALSFSHAHASSHIHLHILPFFLYQSLSISQSLSHSHMWRITRAFTNQTFKNLLYSSNIWLAKNARILGLQLVGIWNPIKPYYWALYFLEE